VRRTIRRHALCPPGTRLLVGLSGGSDSVALTLIMRELSRHGGFDVVALAHLNHRLRATAERDERFCRELAAALGLPLVTEAIDVRGYAQTQHLSLEDAARRLRYDFLDRAAAEVGADRITVGHTQDDQAETFLLKLIRGAGPTGLGGVYPRRGPVVRPLLDASRRDLRAYLRSQGQAWVEDETNDDVENPRNRIRAVVIPELDRVYGASTSGAIARAAALVREDGQWLEELSDRRFDHLVRQDAKARREGVPDHDVLEIPADALRAEPEPIRRRVVRKALRMLADGHEVALEHVESVMEVLSGSCRAAEVPGGRAELRREKLVLVSRRVQHGSPPHEQGPSAK
jgi:tRNA(Ile)-lysidine synthase